MADLQQLLQKQASSKIDLNTPKDYQSKSMRSNRYLSLTAKTIPLRLVVLDGKQFVWPKIWALIRKGKKAKDAVKIDQSTGQNLKTSDDKTIKNGDTYLQLFGADLEDVKNASLHGKSTASVDTVEIHCMNATYKPQELIPEHTMFTLVKPQVVLDYVGSGNWNINRPLIICQDIKVK